MAELTVQVGTYSEHISRTAWFRYDGEWIGLDDRHIWMLVVEHPLTWLGPYWSDAALIALRDDG